MEEQTLTNTASVTAILAILVEKELTTTEAFVALQARCKVELEQEIERLKQEAFAANPGLKLLHDLMNK